MTEEKEVAIGVSHISNTVMEENNLNLVQEIERVVTASYIPSLQDLLRLVRSGGPSAIKYWAIQKPCQVGLLADMLVEGLSRSKTALPLLSSFCSEVIFRDAVLLRHPALLDGVLEKALTVEEGDHEFRQAFPPIRIADLITTLALNIAKSPSEKTIAPVHSLMKGLCGRSIVHYEVSTETMSQLQLELTKILRNFNDHMLVLLSLATFSQIVSTETDDMGNKSEANTPSWLINIEDFFGPKRGLKTLDLVVLRVILACSSSNNELTPSQATESIGLAISIADKIGPEQKKAWMTANSSKIAKLCDKVARDELDREVQFMGTTFLLLLLPAAELPSHIRELGLHVLVSKGSRGAMGVVPHDLISRIAESLAGSDESVIHHLLRLSFEAVKGSDLANQNILSDLHLSNLILKGFQANLIVNGSEAQSTALTAALLDSVSTKDTIFSLLKNFPVESKHSDCRGMIACASEKAMLQNRLLANICDVYFTATLTRHGNNAEALALKAFIDRAIMSHSSSSCSFSRSELTNFRHSVHLRSRQDFSPPRPPVRNWQSVISDALLGDSANSHEILMRRISDACIDLERRCHDVEGPLRRVEEERDQGVLQISHLNQEISQLKHERKEQEELLESSARQRESLQKELAEAEDHLTGLTESLNMAQRQYEDLRLEHDINIQNEQEKARTRELELTADITMRSEEIDKLRANIQALRTNKAAADLLHAEIAKAFDARLAQVNQVLEDTKATCSVKEEKVQALSMEKRRIEHLMTNRASEINDMRASARISRDEHTRAMRSSEENHAKEVSRLSSEVNLQKAVIERQEAEMKSAAENAANELRSKEMIIHDLEMKASAYLI
ncbi:uncharacterized protein N7483_007548 [Penicillium malachiteum]|uniref:uncharacterized protein n=1 Tax=Penicillium malachiteum TaxID=1324776 RepID=UPI002548B41D|nr:uncharacterized protein N7483_007548 [Penicillium malachiteum]KAJ5726191.1 hypothetical protein N7483_007548 [Penicillium malachiteum]